MADNLTKAQRSYCMSKIRSSRTSPEYLVKEKLKGYSYLPKGLFGNPDFINWKNKTVLFVDGCFWHKCPKHWNKPKSNRKYWLPKLDRNVLRDKEIEMAYSAVGWKVERIWEHEIYSKKFLSKIFI